MGPAFLDAENNREITETDLKPKSAIRAACGRPHPLRCSRRYRLAAAAATAQATLLDVVNFHDQRFGIGFTDSKRMTWSIFSIRSDLDFGAPLGLAAFVSAVPWGTLP
jgi:hypothetical protein